MKRRILIIDDDAAVRESVTRVLRRAGYQVVALADGKEAAQQFEQRKFDLVLLDLNLRFERGWDVFERLTSHQPWVPFIIITGMAGQFRSAQTAGAGALMEKPLDVPALLRTIEDLLAESVETRLRRMCGLQTDTRYFRSSSKTADRVVEAVGS